MSGFQAFTSRFNGRTNVLITTVGVSEAFDPNTTPEPSKSITNIQAIWDTGASCSVITKHYAEQIGLVPTGKTSISGVNHTTIENTYVVNVYLPNRVGIVFVKIAEVPALSGNAGMLIGMDIIGAGDFSVYMENGNTVMSYCIPGVGGIDYVPISNTKNASQIIAQRIADQKNHRRQLSSKEQLKRKIKRKNHKKNRKRKH